MRGENNNLKNIKLGTKVAKCPSREKYIIFIVIIYKKKKKMFDLASSF